MSPSSLREPRRRLVPSAAADPPRGRGRGEGAVAAALPCPTTQCGGTGHGPEAGLVVLMVAVNFRISQLIPELENSGDNPRPPGCASSLPLGIGAHRPCPSLSSPSLACMGSRGPGSDGFCPRHPDHPHSSGESIGGSQLTGLCFAEQPHTRACAMLDTVLGLGMKTSPCPPRAHVPAGRQTGARGLDRCQSRCL